MRISSFRIRSSILAPLIAVALAGSVLGGVGPFASSARADDPQRAKELYQEGTRFFDLGQFEKAIDAFQAGYREKPDPIFLYNIAQAYRLAGDANKAIFFYKGYLRNSPKAHNRADVEQKLQALQKQAGEQGQAQHPTSPPTPTSTPGTDSMRPSTPAAAAAPPPAATPAPSMPTPTPSPAAEPLPPPTATPEAPPSETMSGPPTLATALTPQVLDDTRPIDVGLGVGLDGWSSGVQGTAGASLALVLAGGYTFGSDPAAVFHFRLGGALGYTFLKDTSSRDTFLSALVVPTILIRAARRVAVFGELGIGIVGVSGMKANSVLLDPKLTLKLSGTQSLLEIRPAIGVQWQLTDGLGVFGAFAIDYSPKGNHFFEAIHRNEVVVGPTIRF